MARIKDAREAAMIGRRSDGTLTRRPLSPHLQVYDMMQMTSLLSILHRISGVVWCGGLLLFSWWLIAAGTGQGAFGMAQWFFGSFLGWVALFGLTVAAWYHTCAGIRHLFWDAGKGFAMEDAYRSGRMVVIGTVVLTILTWLLILV
ncbi:MAG: succinate dehydrogenase, cytochrome b556 subunit [Acetobacteraceae bacterium]|nr:succinate dehydrogenase, cytochrome b556 subunit [Acetobacteraceae bacterium]